MDISVFAKKLSGSIIPPPFKSEVIRTLILGALCGVSPDRILDSSAAYCGDIIAAKSAVKNAFLSERSPVYVGASAALIRILAPILLFSRSSAVFSCEPQLMMRDMSELKNSLQCNIEYDFASNIIYFSGGNLLKKKITSSPLKRVPNSPAECS